MPNKLLTSMKQNLEAIFVFSHQIAAEKSESRIDAEVIGRDNESYVQEQLISVLEDICSKVSTEDEEKVSKTMMCFGEVLK